LAPCPNAGGVDDAAGVAADQRQHRRLVPLEVADRRGLVLAHEAAVAGDVAVRMAASRRFIEVVPSSWSGGSGQGSVFEVRLPRK
jgi:hypothetical protein